MYSVVPSINDEEKKSAEQKSTAVIRSVSLWLLLVSVLNGEIPTCPGTSRARRAPGRGMTWALTSSPLALAAWAPASTAARTEPTSPRTNVVTKALPICTWPASVTLAALHIASVAAMVAMQALGLDQAQRLAVAVAAVAVVACHE